MKREYNDFHILKAIEADASVSQRTLSLQMQLNVASVNFAMKRLAQKGFIKMTGENTRRTKYYITPKGSRRKTQLAYKSFGRNIHHFNEIREDIEARIVNAANGTKISVAIYGASTLSEITFMVILKMNYNFLGFFHEDSKITNEKLLGHKVQKLNLLKKNNESLLLLTDEFPAETKDIRTLKLVDCNIY
ncbi:MAG: winged helix-turn-helix transcriptional regulator [Planctomycetota bacterium]|jgi:predicted transcriptional regulator